MSKEIVHWEDRRRDLIEKMAETHIRYRNMYQKIEQGIPVDSRELFAVTVDLKRLNFELFDHEKKAP